MLVDDLNTQVAPFEWTLYFEAMGATGLDSLNVSQIEPVKAAVAIITGSRWRYYRIT